MFDNINFKCKCPLCKNEVSDFQSKDGACMLGILEFWEVRNFYASCRSCGLWIEFRRFSDENKKFKISDYLMTMEKTFKKCLEVTNKVLYFAAAKNKSSLKKWRVGFET